MIYFFGTYLFLGIVFALYVVSIMPAGWYADNKTKLLGVKPQLSDFEVFAITAFASFIVFCFDVVAWPFLLYSAWKSTR